MIGNVLRCAAGAPLDSPQGSSPPLRKREAKKIFKVWLKQNRHNARAQWPQLVAQICETLANRGAFAVVCQHLLAITPALLG